MGKHGRRATKRHHTVTFGNTGNDWAAEYDKYSGILNKHAEQRQGEDVGTPTATSTVANTQLECCCRSVLLATPPNLESGGASLSSSVPVQGSAHVQFACSCACWHFINILPTCIFNGRQKCPVPLTDSSEDETPRRRRRPLDE